MRNYSLDTLKLICAVLVIYIHTPQIEGCSEFIAPIFRCAVPIFFMISGYFTYGKKNLRNTLHNRIVGQLKILCWAFALYLFLSLVRDGKVSVSFLAMRAFVMFNFFRYGEHLWYISAYIYVLVVMLFVEKYNLYKILFYVTPFLFMVALLAGSYSEYIVGRPFPVFYTRNFLFTGLPFFVLGMLAKRIRYNIPTSVLIASCMVFYIAGVLEVTQLDLSIGDLYLSTTFLAFSIFLLFLNIRQTKDNLLSRVGRENGLYIYVFHYLIASSINYGDSVLFYLGAPIVLCLTLLFITLLRKVKVIGRII